MAACVSFALDARRASAKNAPMPVWLQVALFVFALVAVVPLFVWANTGRLSAAWHALKQYLLCWAILVVPAALITLAYWLMLQ